MVIINSKVQWVCTFKWLDATLVPRSHYAKAIYIVTKRKGDLEDFEIPVWQGIGPRWYTKLNSVARKYGITRATILEDALKLYEKTLKQKEWPRARAGKISEEDVQKAFGSFAKKWWDNLTPEQREVEAKKRSNAAKARWAKERGEK